MDRRLERERDEKARKIQESQLEGLLIVEIVGMNVVSEKEYRT